MKQNSLRIQLGVELQRRSKKSKQPIWDVVSESLLSTSRNRRAINVSEIARNTKEGSKVLISGKVLGAGSINHGVTVAAYAFSRGALEKIRASNGKCLSIREFMEETANVKDVLLLG